MNISANYFDPKGLLTYCQTITTSITKNIGDKSSHQNFPKIVSKIAYIKDIFFLIISSA